MKTKEKGITLIALIVTIIVLIILAGVSINLVLGKNVLIEKAKLAKEKSQASSEEEIIKLKIIENELNNNYNFGKRLYDKTIENGNRWNIIVLKENNKTYGTDYTYVEKGTQIAKNEISEYSWIINNKTGEIIKLEENSYVELSYNSSVGTTEGLIFNLDPSVIEDANKDNIESKMGKNVELINFDWNENSGLTKKSFNFDGVNDYIKIQYDNEEEKQTLAKNGFTFEFYGILDGGTSYMPEGTTNNTQYRGIFCYWNGKESNQALFRFGIDGNPSFMSLKWNAGYGKFLSDYMEADNIQWNIHYKNVYEPGKKHFYTITLNTNESYKVGEEEYYKQIMYMDGNKLYEGNYNKKSWDKFVNENINDLKYFCIGRSSMQTEGAWHYSKMNAYTLKLYNRGLSEEEIKNNYNKSVAYHDALL